MKRKAMLVAAVSWILGLILAILGLNLAGDTGTWIRVIGEILFLIGLGMEGVLWFQRQKQQEKKDQ